LRKKIKEHVKNEEFRFIEAYMKFEESFVVTNKEVTAKIRNLLNGTLGQSTEIFQAIEDPKVHQQFLVFNSSLIGNLSYFLDTIEDHLDTKQIRKDFKAGFLITDSLFTRMAFEDYSCLKRFGDDIRNFSSSHYQDISRCMRLPVVKIQYFKRLALTNVQKIKEGIAGIFQKLWNCRDLERMAGYACSLNIVSIYYEFDGFLLLGRNYQNHGGFYGNCQLKI
jgi:hypothetical protein